MKKRMFLGEVVRFLPVFIGLGLIKFVPESFKNIPVRSPEGLLMTVGVITIIIIACILFGKLGDLVKGSR